MLGSSGLPPTWNPLYQKSQRASVPMVCGELVYGSLDGIPCVVSCPIERFSTATIQTISMPAWGLPERLPRLSKAFRLALDCLPGVPKGGMVTIESTLPPGRGFGSSTAEIGAALFALGKLSGTPLEPLQAARLAVQVEPTASSLFEGLAIFDHRTGSTYEDLGAAPNLAALVIDPGEEVDPLVILKTNEREALRRLAPDHLQAFNLLRSGLYQLDMGAIGEAATLSARLGQALLENPLLETACDLARQVHALGVCRAHIGTLLGLLLDPSETDLPAVLVYVQNALPAGVECALYPLTGGGPRFLSAPGSRSA
jgi:L-threonine kinase